MTAWNVDKKTERAKLVKLKKAPACAALRQHENFSVLLDAASPPVEGIVTWDLVSQSKGNFHSIWTANKRNLIFKSCELRKATEWRAISPLISPRLAGENKHLIICFVNGNFSFIHKTSFSVHSSQIWKSVESFFWNEFNFASRLLIQFGFCLKRSALYPLSGPAERKSLQNRDEWKEKEFPSKQIRRGGRSKVNSQLEDSREQTP